MIPGDNEPLDYNFGEVKSKVFMRALFDCQPEEDYDLHVRKNDIVEFVGVSENGNPVGISENEIGFIQMEAFKVNSSLFI